MKKLLTFFLLLALLSCQKRIDTREPTVDEASIINHFAQMIEDDLKQDNLKGSISAAIVHKNKIIWTQAFGYADGEYNIPADTKTIYRIGSISKSFTAVAMMKLMEEGKFKLDDPIEDYLPEVKQLKGYSDSTKITFRMLAGHMSGLASEPALDGATKGFLDDWETKLLECIPTTSFESKPGTAFHYSNIGYGILGLAISRAAGKPFMELVTDKIFIPLRMEETMYRVPEELKVKLAVGMNGGPSEPVDLELPKRQHDGRGYKVPPGGIYSTPNDLAKFMASNMGYNTIIKKKNRALMLSNVSENYGLGFIRFHNDTINIAGHGGQVPGYTSTFLWEEESEYGVIMLRNYTQGATDLDNAAFELLGVFRKARKR